MIRLISKTIPVIEGINTAEELITYVARVSNPQNQANTTTAAKLLKYCIENKHWSIFEHGSFTIEVETTLAIAPQILRHRSFMFQQFSGRYADITEMGYEITRPRRQDYKNRQNSFDDLPEDIISEFQNRQEENTRKAIEDYRWAIQNGIAKESARFLLPSNMKTRLYITGNIRSWIHYLETRTDKSAQMEHVEIAKFIKSLLKQELPIISEVLGW